MAARCDDDPTVSTQNEKQDDKHTEVESSDEDKPLITVREKIRKEKDILEDLNDIGNLWDSSWESDDSAKDPTFKVNKKELNKSDSSDNETGTAAKRKKYKKKLITADNNQAKIIDSEKVKAKDNLYKKQKASKKNRKTQGLPSLTKIQQRIQNKNKNKGLYSRDKNWKRKPSNFNRKQFIQGRPKTPNLSRKFKIRSENSDAKSLLRAKRISHGMFKVRECLNNLHLRTLDALLYSNGLKRKEIEGDGNCFFAALKESSGLQDELLKMRNNICDHIKENRDDYIGFLKKNEKSCEEETIKDSFNRQLDTLRQSGSWSVDLSDVLPLAVANYTKREITIYTSKRSNPVISVKPTVHFDQLHGPPIFLAYVATPGFEHYDSCEVLGLEHDQTGEGKDN
ncbi:MAG: OTU domain-containing protein, partial [Candidatus Thiodiazotropha sp.]